MNNLLSNFDGSRGRDGGGIKRVHIPASGQDVGITDGVPTRSGHEELPVEELHDARQLVVSHDLLEAEFDVGEDRRQELLIHAWEAGIDDRLGPRLLCPK